jgi:copper(I)-binding protein
MNKGTARRLAVALVVFLLVACSPQVSAGPDVRVEDVWSRPAVMLGETESEGEMSRAGTGAVFLTLINQGQEAERLIGAQTDVADTVEVHQTVMEGDVMRMQRVEYVEIGAGAEVLLKPGDYHIMLIGMRRDLAVGDRFSVTLLFENSDPQTVEAEVRQP